MKGCQFRVAISGLFMRNTPAIAMNVSTIATFTITMAELKFADS